MNSLITNENNNNIFSKILGFFKSLFSKNKSAEAVAVVEENAENDFLPEVNSGESPEVETKVEETTEESNNLKVTVDSVEIAKEAKRKQIIEQIKRDPKLLDKMTLNEIDKIYNYINKNIVN